MPFCACKDIYSRCFYEARSLKYSFSRLGSANSVGFFRIFVHDGRNVSCFLFRTVRTWQQRRTQNKLFLKIWFGCGPVFISDFKWFWQCNCIWN